MGVKTASSGEVEPIKLVVRELKLEGKAYPSRSRTIPSWTRTHNPCCAWTHPRDIFEIDSSLKRLVQGDGVANKLMTWESTSRVSLLYSGV